MANNNNADFDIKYGVLAKYNGKGGEVVIPNNVSRIVTGAFKGCSSVESIKIPGNVTSIESFAFSGCSSLKSITIKDGVKSIGWKVFCGCSSLERIVIPNSVTSIGWYAFSGCSSLKRITIPGGVTNIGRHFFDTCESLENVTIPNSVTSIGDFAFSGCSSLKRITIPGSVTSIGDFAFSECRSLKSITIPGSVTFIGDQAFYGCSSLKSIEVEEGNPVYHSAGNCIIETNKKKLIAGCNNSRIPDDGSVASIGRYAFSGCSSLKSITIPDGVTSIGWHAFADCDNLQTIEYAGTEEQWEEVDKWEDWSDNVEITFLAQKNRSMPGKKDDNADFVINDGVLTKYVGNGGDVVIPKNVSRIGTKAFKGCSSVESIEIPGNVTSIESFAFDGCSSLKSITIPDSVTSIGKGAFWWCSSLASVTIPDGVTSIWYAFSGCRSLASITIPHGVTSIGDGAFWWCSSLASVTIPDSVTRIGDKAFCGCSSLKSITIPHGVTSIGDGAFGICVSLASITIPESVTSIGPHVFADCDNLRTIEYAGTEEQWEKVDKWEDWSDNVKVITARKGSKAMSTAPAKEVVARDEEKSGTTTAPAKAIATRQERECETTTAPAKAIATRQEKECETTTAPAKAIATRQERECETTTAPAKAIATRQEKECETTTAPAKAIATRQERECETTTAPAKAIATRQERECETCTAGVNDNDFIIENGVLKEYVGNGGDVVIPDGVTSIGERAFSRRESIDWYPFSDCRSLKSITIPSSIKSIGKRVFERCSALESIVVSKGNPVYHSNENCIIETRSKKLIAGCNNSRIPDDGSVTSIGDFAFCECSFLKNITIPGSVTKIGYKSFYGCSFKSVTMQNGVKKIGSCAFEGCSSLKSMTIPKSVKKIGLSAFDGEEELNYAGSSNEFERIRFKLSFSIGVTVRCNDGVWEFKKEYKPTISEKLKDEQHVAARRIFNTFCVLSGMIGVILFVLLIVDPWEDYTFGGVAANTTLSLGSIFLCMSAGVLISGNILIDGTYWQRFISSLAGISLCGTLIAGIFYVVGNNDTAIAAGQALPWLSLPLGSLPLLCYFEINKNILADKHFVLKLFAGLIGLLIAAGMIWGFSSAIFFIKTISLW